MKDTSNYLTKCKYLMLRIMSKFSLNKTHPSLLLKQQIQHLQKCKLPWYQQFFNHCLTPCSLSDRKEVVIFNWAFEIKYVKIIFAKSSKLCKFAFFKMFIFFLFVKQYIRIIADISLHKYVVFVLFNVISMVRMCGFYRIIW